MAPERLFDLALFCLICERGWRYRHRDTTLATLGKDVDDGCECLYRRPDGTGEGMPSRIELYSTVVFFFYFTIVLPGVLV